MTFLTWYLPIIVLTCFIPVMFRLWKTINTDIPQQERLTHTLSLLFATIIFVAPALFLLTALILEVTS